MKVSVIIPAAGLGTRMGRTAPEKEGISRKQFMLLSGSPILVHTIRKFVSVPSVTEIVVALRPHDMEWATDLFHKEGLQHVVRTVAGGESRQQSVENALASIGLEIEMVAVHDGPAVCGKGSD
jgi:2-C-methyl-D-erythritol 4-phosphate cytidylyltransferase